MSKRSHRSLSKKGLKGSGLIRIKNAEGKRVWKINGEEIQTLREVVAKYGKR